MTKKQKYISAYLDGYFSDKNIKYGFSYFNELDKTRKQAEKNYMKTQNLINFEKLIYKKESSSFLKKYNRFKKWRIYYVVKNKIILNYLIIKNAIFN
jgi:hypothetical protein